MPTIVAVPLLLLLFAASAFPWLLVLRARFGQLLAIPGTAGGAFFLLLVVLSISHLLNTNYLWSLVVASIVFGGFGAVLARRTPGVLRRPGRYAVALWCPALLGAVVWIVTVAAAQFLPGASRFGWVMNGDALNNLYFASATVHDNGIALNYSANPVPLPAAIIATGLGAGSPANGSASAALAHQLSALTLVWVILLAALCIAFGVVAASLVSPTLTRTVATVSAIGSLLPLTWLVSGLTIQWGYFNVDVVVPIALGAWIIYLGSARHPVAALVGLIGFATLALTAWTPIAILVVALGVALVVRHRRYFLTLRRRPLAAVLIAVAFGLVFFGLVSFPALFAQYRVLQAPGTGFQGFANLWWPVPVLAVLVVGTLVLVRRRTTMPTTSATVGILVGGAVASALLVFLARGDSDAFGAYYPKKFAWILLVLFGLIALSFLIGAFAGLVRTSLLATIAIIAVLAAAFLPPSTWPEMVQRQPVARILGDYVRHDGEAAVRTILRLTTAQHPTLLWQSGDPDEPIINEWLLLSHGGLTSGNNKLIQLVGTPYFLYRSTGRYEDSQVTSLCQILAQLPSRPEVITASNSLASQLRSACPNSPVHVVVTTSLVGPRPATTGQSWQTDGIEGPSH